MFVAYENIVHGEIRKMIKELNRSGLLKKRIMLIPKMTKNQLATAFIQGIQQCYDDGNLDYVSDEIYDYYLSIVRPDKKQPQEPQPEVAEPPQKPEKPKGRGKRAPSPTKKASSLSENAKVAATKKKRGRPKKKSAVKKTKPVTKKTRGRKKVTKKATIVKKKSATPRVKRGPGRPRKHPKVKKPASQSIKRSAETTGHTRAGVYARIVQDKKPRTKQEIVAEMAKLYKGSRQEAVYWVGGYNGLLIALGKMVKRADGMFVYKG